MVEVQLIVKNEFGDFFGEKVTLSEDNLSKIIETSRDFYKLGGFELNCEGGEFVVFPSDVIRKSILKVVCKKIEKNDV